MFDFGLGQSRLTFSAMRLYEYGGSILEAASCSSPTPEGAAVLLLETDFTILDIRV